MTDDVISALTIRVRQQLQLMKAAGIPIDRPTIEASVRADAPVLGMAIRHSFSEIETEAAVRALETQFSVQQGKALSIVDLHRPPNWYVGERRRPGPFMKRYLEKLQESDWPVSAVEVLEESTARVLELMDDPQRDGPWDWRGLVVGDVQSGKTAHYAGVINRAADAGYRVIVVLAGMHSILRLQTQKRLEEDFLGFDTNPKARLPEGGRKLIGVGELNPHIIADSLTNATLGGDFSLRVANQANFAPLSQPCLLVIKKNARLLENLNNWIRRLPDASRAAPLLVVDDEADQASVDTGDQPLLPDGSFDEDYNPKRVNGEIRKLLLAFERSAYAGYTATPFANILIHDERHAEQFGADLFPSTFIVSLSPPDDYFGPSAVFGTNDSENGGLPVIRHVDQTGENWIPDRHDKTLRPKFDDEDIVPPSLARAIDSFLLTCAARAARGRATAHNSMLVHVSRFVDVHKAVHAQADRYVAAVKARISGGDTETIARLESVWRSDYVPTTSEMESTIYFRQAEKVTWQQVLACLPDSTDKIQVLIANGSNKKDFEYESYKDTGRTLIAIGGDKLSRGLTLEGLSVSYFLRISKQYDSLLQMGRWFGYRRGYADLCRLFTTADMEDWFRHVATANKELRTQFAHMQITDATPKEYGLRVQAHSILNVTAANKQRHADQRQISYAGEGPVQTIMFSDRSHVERNALTTDAFLSGLGGGDQRPLRPGGKGTAPGVLWTGVSGRSISEYLSNLVFPPEVDFLDGKNMAKYIRDQMDFGELNEWSVYLASANKAEVQIGGHKIGCVQRTPRSDRSTPGRYIVRTILSPLDEAIDLSDDEFRRALAKTNSARVAQGQKETDRPTGRIIRIVRGERPQNGLLLIYPMDPQSAQATETDKPVIGVVVSFPESSTALRRIYLQNVVKSREDAHERELAGAPVESLDRSGQ